MHCNQKNTVLQLQVDIFAFDVIDSINAWLSDIHSDTEKKKKLNELVTIYDSFAF